MGAALLVRSEFLGRSEDKGIDTNGAYVEAAYMFTEHWQAAARWDWNEIDANPSLTEHKHEEIGFGINYWLNPSMVMKVSYHRVDGNRFASKGDGGDPELVDVSDTTTELLLVGVNFSF